MAKAVNSIMCVGCVDVQGHGLSLVESDGVKKSMCAHTPGCQFC